MELSNIEAAFLFIIIPILIIVYILHNRIKNRQLKKIGKRNIVSQLYPEQSIFRKHFKFTLVLIGLIFLIIALMGPRWGKRSMNFMQKGIEEIIAVDVSKSMLAEDVKPSRLEIGSI